jgi:uncharacterized membrane protein YhhN
MISLCLVATGAAALVLHLIFKEGHPLALGLAFKAAASLSFVALALVQPRADRRYFILILIGLVLGLAGDLLLRLPAPIYFKLGVLAFLLGHVCYVVAFLALTWIDRWPSAWLIPIWAISAVVMIWLWPHARAQSMLGPVVAYVLVITVMVSGAVAVFRNPNIEAWGRRLVLIGAILFYLSDVLVARERFVSPGAINWIVSLPIYYAAQFMLAFSVGRVGPASGSDRSA